MIRGDPRCQGRVPNAMSADLSRDLDQHRGYLLRVARLQLRDEALAEDVVQETLLAALSGSGFSGKSSLRTWLTGILKHKIVDAIRKASRERPLDTAEAGDDLSEFDPLFDERGHWAETPDAWEQPEGALGQKQFLAALEACLQGLPAKTAQAFMMREHLGLETDEICQELGITSTHCWVMLYRARMSLRLCLEKNWFANT